LSPCITAEIVKRAAKDDIQKLALAGLILITGWCWDRWNQPVEGFDHLREWVKDVLLADPAWGYGEKIKW